MEKSEHSPRSYKKPPITEAIIEFRFKSSIDEKTIEKVVDKFKKDYPIPPTKNMLVDITVGDSAPSAKQRLAGVRLASSDGTSVMVISSNAISASQLAPYCGWQKFSELARRNFGIYRKLVGNNTLTRIGMRYINRLDVPRQESGEIDPSQYIAVYPNNPEDDLIEFYAFALNTSGSIRGTDYRIVTNAGLTDSPILKHVSIILDLDISKISDLPQSESGIWTTLDEMRILKNKFFERYITDAARELFST